MRKIGFVDYYLSEWHANQYPAWIKAANELLGTDFAVSYAWAEQEISPVDGKSTAEWCEKYGAAACEPRTKSIRFFIMILPAFLARVKPASTIAKPACIKNTNAAPIRYQMPNISLSTV